jgi:hypothetical protein
MPEYKLLARGGEGSQIFRRENRLLLAMGNILLPLDYGRLNQVFRLAKRIRRKFDHYQQDQCVLINYEMAAFRFTRSQLDDFIRMLDDALTRSDSSENATLYPGRQNPPGYFSKPNIPPPPDLPHYSRN